MNIHGFKKQKGQAQKPQIAPDDLVSVSYANILYGLAEGEIDGLADGGKSIKLDGTPLINDNGQPNFTGVNFEFRTGTLDQSHIAGFPAVENETNVGVELRSDRPWVKAITNRELSAVRIRLNFNALREQKDNGDITGYAISYAIDVQTDGGSFVEVLTDTARGKASSGYKKSHRIDLPNAGTAKRWTIRVRRITPNQDNDLISDTVHIDALTEIIDAKLAYPCTALLGLSYDAKTFANIAKLAVRLKGKIIQVPTNYNPQTRTYNGLWDGTFKLAYSNNPAWVFYDLCTHKRYGLGERLSGMVDKWRLYQIGQYCDELVDDGKGGQEPRFTCNVYIQKADDAYRVLQNLAGVFRGLSFWDGSNIVVDADTPKESVYTFSPANVVGGEFAYTGTRARDRHTLAKVAWDNPDNGFNTEYELIPDEQAIAKYGVRTLDISAFGCTSKGQAQRAGLWALKAEQLETQTVSFKTGLQGFIPQVGQVINIADNVFAGRAVSGKIMAVSANKRQITLDRVAGKVGDTLTVNGTTGVQSAKISAVRGQVLTLNQPINAEPEHIWAVISDDLKLKQFRILTIAQNDDATFDITALQYEYQKYDVIDHGAIVKQQPYTVLKASPITAPKTVHITAHTRTHQGQSVTTMTINWEQVTGAVAYIVKWRKDNGNWQTLPKVSGQSVDIDGVYAGGYVAQVQAVDSFDNESLATYSALTHIKGKIGKPPRLTSLTVQGVLFGMNLSWVFARGSDDTNFTEIQVSPDGKSNITTLGQFAYPTNKHEITGLQGGLTQFYRGRIVDKLGNTSDWTEWVRGVTDNQAEKVLNLISGQINESHLHQTLITPIGKIGTLESAVNAINGQLPTLNGQIATLNSKATTLQNELNTAKNTLQTAVGNIATERNRITSAIRDITTLQSANNAKTQELANLTQTVNGHTSQVRDLAVTTGDLSHKYTQLKTATDTANSEITAIKQTQSGQAVSIERLGAKFDNLSVGGRNLLLDTGSFVSKWRFAKDTRETASRVEPADGVLTLTGTQPVWKYWYQRSKQGTALNSSIATNPLLNDIVDGKEYTLSYEAKGDVRLRIFTQLYYLNGIATQAPFSTYQNVTSDWVKYSHTFTLNHKDGHAEHFNYFSLLFDNNSVGTVQIRKIKLERGNVATDWTPAPEDLQADLSPYATTANLENLRQTLSDKDTALSQQITALDTAYKSADNNLTARLAREETARTNGDTALTRQIDSLQTDYNNNRASVANQLKTLSDKDTATASQISSLTAEMTTTKQTANSATAKANNAQNTANNAQNTASNALTHANTANSAITAEQKARADADTALSQQITALDTAYKSADNNLTARLAREETARANADNANAQTLHALESTVNGIGGRLGTSESKIATLERTTSDTNQALATAQSQINARFDNLSVGGRNLLLDTGSFVSKWGFGKDGSETIPYIPPADGTLTLTGVKPVWKNWHQISKQGATANSDVANPLLNDIVNGKEYTLSYEAKGNVPLRIFMQLYYSNGIATQAPFSTYQNVTSDWVKYSHTFTLNHKDGHAKHFNYLALLLDNTSVGTIYIRKLKLERGNVATDWTPAPEDLQSDIDEKVSMATLDDFKHAQATKDTATAHAVQTLQTTVQGQTASIQQHAQSLNGLSAQWTLKVQSGNIVSGIGLASSNGISDFAVRADKFYIASPHGQKVDTPFVVLTHPQFINGVQVPAGAYIKDAYIQNGSITSAKIANASIDNAKIANGSIDTAKIRDGVITTAKIGIAQIDTLQIAGGAITVPRMQFNAGTRRFAQGGEIELGRMTIDSQGGNVMISMGFIRLFSIPNGAYSWGSFAPAVASIDFHNFVHLYADDVATINKGDVSFHIRRNGMEIHRIIFQPNYSKAETTSNSWLNINRATPILLYNQYAMPQILDMPPAGDNVYTVVMVIHSTDAHFNNDRNVERQTRITGFSFGALSVKR